MVKNDHTDDFGISIRRRIISFPTLISFVLAFSILYFLGTRFSIDLDATFRLVSKCNPVLYGMAVLSYYTTFIFRGLRWRILLKNAIMQDQKLLPSTLTAARMVLMGWFVSAISWFRMGDVYRAYVYSRESKASLSKIIGTIFAERVMDVVMVFIIILLSFILLYVYSDILPPRLFLAIAIALAFTSVFLLLLMKIFRRFMPKFIPNKIQSVYRGFHSGTMNSFRTLPTVLLLGFLGWMAEVFRLYFVVWALGLDVHFGLILFITVATALLSALPLTPGGLGIVETSIVGLMMLTEIRENALSVALLDRSINYVSVIITGGMAFMYHNRVLVNRRYDGNYHKQL